ncbi:MAG TPA: hydrogenase maturation nickel metallochaperone HypA, partial [Propionibacteriaceae bacterium]|nr:hydrogenase maturation nickel metallochaperone HypA [Propionibacteriaceae bacterium]
TLTHQSVASLSTAWYASMPASWPVSQHCQATKSMEIHAETALKLYIESRLRDLKDRLMVIPEAEMHELAIAESIVQAVQSRIGDRPVRSVHLQVGQLSGVLIDALTFSFELAASGTPLEGAELLIDEPRGRLHCRTCGHDVGRDDLLLLCECGSADVEVTAGRELTLVSVEVT